MRSLVEGSRFCPLRAGFDFFLGSPLCVGFFPPPLALFPLRSSGLLAQDNKRKGERERERGGLKGKTSSRKTIRGRERERERRPEGQNELGPHTSKKELGPCFVPNFSLQLRKC